MNGNGDNSRGGFWGSMIPPGQRENINRSEVVEIKADDARGLRLVLLNVLIILLIIFAIIVLGPIAVIIGVPAIIFAISYGLALWLGPFEPCVQDEQEQDGSGIKARQFDHVTFIWIVCCVAIIIWLLLSTTIWYPAIVAWYPFKITLSWWLLGIVFAIGGAILYGLLDWREAHRRSLYNRNYPPTYQQAPYWVGPYYKGGSPPDDDNGKAEIMAMLQGVLDNRPAPQIVPRPVPVYNKDNPNPNAQQVQDELAAQIEKTRRELPPKDEIFSAPYGKHGTTVAWKDLVEMVWTGLDCGISVETWHERKCWGKPYISAIHATLKQHGIAESRGEGSPYRLCITNKSEAAAALRALHMGLFPEQYPPTLPTTETVQDENTSDLDGGTVVDGGTL